jgi:hypothetical protein
MARFQRKFIDPNRPPEIAYDSPASASFYEYHHRSIRQFVDEIVRGTLNGCAVTRLPARVGIDAVTDPKGLFGQLKTNGFIVFPTNDVLPSGKSEDGGFNGWLHGREVRQPSREQHRCHTVRIRHHISPRCRAGEHANARCQIDWRVLRGLFEKTDRLSQPRFFVHSTGSGGQCQGQERRCRLASS